MWWSNYSDIFTSIFWLLAEYGGFTSFCTWLTTRNQEEAVQASQKSGHPNKGCIASADHWGRSPLAVLHLGFKQIFLGKQQPTRFLRSRIWVMKSQIWPILHSLLGRRPLLLGWRPSLLGGGPTNMFFILKLLKSISSAQVTRYSSQSTVHAYQRDFCIPRGTSVSRLNYIIHNTTYSQINLPPPSDMLKHTQPVTYASYSDFQWNAWSLQPTSKGT